MAWQLWEVSPQKLLPGSQILVPRLHSWLKLLIWKPLLFQTTNNRQCLSMLPMLLTKLTLTATIIRRRPVVVLSVWSRKLDRSNAMLSLCVNTHEKSVHLWLIVITECFKRNACKTNCCAPMPRPCLTTRRSESRFSGTGQAICANEDRVLMLIRHSNALTNSAKLHFSDKVFFLGAEH